jgi:hypothetical protein
MNALIRHALCHDLAALRSLDGLCPTLCPVIAFAAPVEHAPDYTSEECAWFRGPVREGLR